MKTRLGISVALLGAATYFLGLVGGWVPVVIVAGYILLLETNEWLRMSAVKAVGICIFFSVATVIVGLIPNAISLVSGVFNLFSRSFALVTVTQLVNLVTLILSVAERLLLLMLGFKALHQGTVSFGVIDRLIAKHILRDNH